MLLSGFARSKYICCMLGEDHWLPHSFPLVFVFDEVVM